MWRSPPPCPADDNEDAVAALAMLLELMGHTVHVAHDGSQAVALAAACRPDVILLDIGMPMMNGYEACRHIRDQPWATHTVIVALTGWGQDEDKRRATDAGFTHHVVKPIDPTALGACLLAIGGVGQRPPPGDPAMGGPRPARLNSPTPEHRRAAEGPADRGPHRRER
jgi:CheY-like chemotaxis protein